MEDVDICNLALIQLGQTTITALTDDNENARRCNTLYEPVRDELMEKHPWNFAIERDTLVDVTKPDTDAWETATSYAVDDTVEYSDTHYTCLVAHTSGVFSDDLSSGDWETTTTWTTGITYLLGTKVYHSGIHYSCVEVHTSGTWATDLAAGKWVTTVEPEFDFDHSYRVPTDSLRVLRMSVDVDYKIEGDYLYTDETTCKIKYIKKVTDADEYPPSFIIALSAALAEALSLAITNNRNITADAKVHAKQKKLEALGSDAQGGGLPDEPKCSEWLDER